MSPEGRESSAVPTDVLDLSLGTSAISADGCHPREPGDGIDEGPLRWPRATKLPRLPWRGEARHGGAEMDTRGKRMARPTLRRRARAGREKRGNLEGPQRPLLLVGREEETGRQVKGVGREARYKCSSIEHSSLSLSWMKQLVPKPNPPTFPILVRSRYLCPSPPLSPVHRHHHPRRAISRNSS